MKVIFLDIDGVLNCSKMPNPKKLPYIIDRRLLRRLIRVVDQTSAKIILTSTWRYDPIGRYAAKHYGIRYIGWTPDLAKKPRCQEIKQWLREHPHVSRYVVIDDEDDELDTLPLFQPSSNTGLSPEIAKAVIRYLNADSDEDMRRSSLFRMVQDATAVLRRHPG